MKQSKEQKAALKIVKKIFPKATVEFGIHMTVIEVGDPKLSQLYKLSSKLRSAGLINKQQTINFSRDDEGSFILSCTIAGD